MPIKKKGTKLIEKRYIVRKYIVAKSVQDAINKERSQQPDDVWVDDDWKKENAMQGSPIGFNTN